jgi:hypothetical protein
VSVTFSSIYAYNTTGVADINNTNKIYGNNAWFHGGGGGGGTQQGSGGVPYGGAGYKGIVVVSYEWPYQLATGGTVTSSGGRYYHYLTDTGQQFSW